MKAKWIPMATKSLVTVRGGEDHYIKEWASDLSVEKCLSLGWQFSYSVAHGTNNILGYHTIVIHITVTNSDNFTNSMKIWVCTIWLKVLISSYNLVLFGKLYHAKDPHTVNVCLPKHRSLIFKHSGHMPWWILRISPEGCFNITILFYQNRNSLYKVIS